eukprot:scaffold87385_cov33-Tisochrysis_lutea.AAC.1
MIQNCRAPTAPLSGSQSPAVTTSQRGRSKPPEPKRLPAAAPADQDVDMPPPPLLNQSSQRSAAREQACKALPPLNEPQPKIINPSLFA